MTGFDEFWKAYPRKVGKLAAQKAYTKARGSATQSELLAGVASYMQHKPQYADYCHPATWLNQGRWMDEHDTSPAPERRRAAVEVERPITHDERQRAEQVRRARGGCLHDPSCPSAPFCVALIVRQWREQEREALSS